MSRCLQGDYGDGDLHPGPFYVGAGGRLPINSNVYLSVSSQDRSSIAVSCDRPVHGLQVSKFLQNGRNKYGLSSRATQVRQGLPVDRNQASISTLRIYVGPIDAANSS
jgi:hypothetical protein